MCSNCVPQVQEKETEAFAGKLLDILNGGGLALMISIGHRTGLFDVMAELPASNSHEIAIQGNLQERYVREWLGAMVTGGIIRFDPDSGKYELPNAHAALLTRASSPDNVASTMQWISVLGAVEDEIVDAFRDGGGVHYSAFKRFHDVMADESSQTVVAALHDHILPLVPELGEKLEAGIDVLDVGCGSGCALIRLAAAFPASRFVGFDFCEEAIDKANALAEAEGLKNVRFAVKDVTDLGTDEFDLVTAFDAIHDQRDPHTVLQEIQRVLRGEGIFLMQDISSSSHLHKNLEHPIGSFLYTISTMHCMTVSLAQGGAGLGTCWGEELAEEMLGAAGFDEVKIHQLSHDLFNSYFVSRKSSLSQSP